jgi:phosphatidylethanolamine-binding protein (PEBP) family uncharacterized protein
MNQRVLKGNVFGRMCVALSALFVLAVGLLAGCGGGSASTSSLTPGAPGSPTPGQASSSSSSVDAVAFVSGAPIAKASYEHWLAVEKALGVVNNPSHRALGFLLTSEWVLGEAAARHISVSEAEVKQRFAQLERQSFSKAGSLQRFLAKSGESEADLLARVKVELLQSRIVAKLTAGKSATQSKTLLASFEKAFQQHWKSYTTCKAAYVMEDCSEYKGKPENLAATSSSSSTSSGRSKSSSAASSSTGQVYTPPGGFSLTSSAFERNGAIPAQYTCAGAGISPPLSWQHVPARAAELVLFVIDDNSSGSTGGIRWIVGGISPSSTGVAAGKLPPGGIVGTNTAGKAAYSPICPAHGKSDTIEFVMYALKKTIPLSPGFQPSKAESEYGSGKLLMGSAAVTYGTASR